MRAAGPLLLRTNRWLGVAGSSCTNHELAMHTGWDTLLLHK
jgi:hypothetical protein